MHKYSLGRDTLFIGYIILPECLIQVPRTLGTIKTFLLLALDDM